MIGGPLDILVGLAFIAAGVGIIIRHAVRRPPEIIGRNEAVKRMLSR